MKSYVLGVLSSVLCFLAWANIGSSAGALLGWLGCFSIIAAARSNEKRYLPVYFAGVIEYLLGFPWLYNTIKIFGGFPTTISAFLFIFFVFVSALQYLVFMFIFKNLPSFFEKFALRAGCAWICSEILSIRIFPWEHAHSQLGFETFVQIADLGSTPLISFVMFWACESAYKLIAQKHFDWKLFLAPCALAASVGYGIFRIHQVESFPVRPLAVQLVQANISIEDKHNVALIVQNEERYRELTERSAQDGQLVIWPESVIQSWVFVGIGLANLDKKLPHFEKKINLLSGALTYRNKDEFFNSALAIYLDGRVPEPSHKQILMPFGEYTPFSETFPWLMELNRGAPNFSAGTEVKVFNFPPLDPKGSPAKVAPLICYEDLIPALSRSAVRQGAELLVNLTNDAWFGRSFAALHHDMMATFRAIENRRFLLRSTNTGYTTVINPLGRRVAAIEPYSEGYISTSVNLINEETIYTRHVGSIPLWILVIGSCLGVVFRKMRRS